MSSKVKYLMHCSSPTFEEDICPCEMCLKAPLPSCQLISSACLEKSRLLSNVTIFSDREWAGDIDEDTATLQ